VISSWKQFEKTVARIQQQLAPRADVKWNDKLYGHESQTTRQVDVSIRARIGQFEILIVMDCKDYKSKIDVPMVGDFANMVKDIRAHRGALVARNGFTKKAKTYATSLGIDLFSIVDVKQKDWRDLLAFPCVYKGLGISTYQLAFTSPDEPVSSEVRTILALRNICSVACGTKERFRTSLELMT
jgi:hypothetical protein